MKKFPKIKRIGHSANDGILDTSKTIFVQEKMDGANFRFTLARNIDGGLPKATKPDDLIFGSRNVVYKNDKDVDKNFRHAVEYVRKNVDISVLKALDRDNGPLVFYGEAMHSHTLDYDWDDIPNFLGFDIWSERHQEFLASGPITGMFRDIGLETVPDLYCGPAENFNIDEIPDSEYRDGVAEGFVIKRYDTGQRAKVRSEKFKEMHRGGSGKTPEEYEPEDATVLALQFATEARILKMIHKYDDRGRQIEMAVMEDLWRDVFDDIIEEEYETIFLGNHTLDTQQFRSKVASRTADVLQRYLNRPDGSVLNEVNA